MQLYTFPAVAKYRKPASAASQKFRPGDIVEWLNPNTNARWPNLRVLSVNKSTGAILLKGWIGRLARDGSEHQQTFTALADQLTLTLRGDQQ